MSLDSQLTLKFENGDPVWFALHERVTNLPQLAQLIKKHHGIVVDNIGEADFCLLSACRPEATEAAARVVEEGGNAIDASWIWESNTLGRLLPWYPYQLGKVNKHPDMSDEIRDTHELATSLARYLPFASDVGAIYAHLAMRLPHRTATQFKQLHEQRKQAIDACILHMANQMDNINPPTGYFNNSNSHVEINDSGAQSEPPISLVTTRRPPPSDSLASSTSATVGRTSMLLDSIIPKSNHMRARMGDSGSTPKSTTLPSVTAAEPPPTSVNPDGGEVDLTPVGFPIEEQDFEIGTRLSAEPVLPRVTTSSNTTPRPSNVAPAPAKSTQHDSRKTTQNSRPSQSPRAQAEGSIQSPNESRIPPQDGVVAATTMATKEKTPPLQNASNVGGPSAVSHTQPQKLQRRNRVPVPHLLDAMEEEETPEEDESDGGEYVLRTAKVRPRDGDDSDEEERPKRRRKKNRPKDKGAEKVRENGERKSGKPTVPQHQVDAMLQWGSTHPMEKGVNQKVYWSKFVEESDIGKERTWASWDAISRHYGRPPMLDEPGPVQQSPAIVAPAVKPHAQPRIELSCKPASTFHFVIPPASGNTNPAETKNSGTSQVTSTSSNRPLPSKVIPSQIYHPKPSHITSTSGRATSSSESTSNGMATQLRTDARQEHTSLMGSSGVKSTPPSSSKPPVNRPRLVFSFNGNTNDKETSGAQNGSATPTVPSPKPGLHSAVGVRRFGGFTHSVRGPAAFQSRPWDPLSHLPNLPGEGNGASRAA